MSNEVLDMMGPSVSPIRGKQVLAASVQLSGAITDRGEYYAAMLQRKPPSLPPCVIYRAGRAEYYNILVYNV